MRRGRRFAERVIGRTYGIYSVDEINKNNKKKLEKYTKLEESEVEKKMEIGDKVAAAIKEKLAELGPKEFTLRFEMFKLTRWDKCERLDKILVPIEDSGVSFDDSVDNAKMTVESLVQEVNAFCDEILGKKMLPEEIEEALTKLQPQLSIY